NPLIQHGPVFGGQVNISMAVEDYEPYRRRLEEHGVPYCQDPNSAIGLKQLFCQDPDGNGLEFMIPESFDEATQRRSSDTGSGAGTASSGSWERPDDPFTKSRRPSPPERSGQHASGGSNALIFSVNRFIFNSLLGRS
ncbi:MAG: hypothetical protein QF451_00795, partial [Nitrospinota bacterium]|nr:hypothetical protein [Nitrospinota bacterium]